MTAVPKTIRDMVTKRIANDMLVLNAHYNTNHSAPKVLYDVRGQNAGYVSPRDGWSIIHLNPILLIENVDEMVNQTTPHELAHHWDHQINGDHHRSWNGKRSVHGARWKAIMYVLGVDPDRCHSMNVTNAQVRVKNKFEYECSGCGHKMTVGPVVHKKLQRGDHRWHKGCGSSTKIVYVGDLGQVTYQQAKDNRSHNRPTPVPQAPGVLPTEAAIPVAPGSTKKQKAQVIYDTMILQGKTRGQIIDRFMASLSMTKAGASTYYHNVNK